MGKVNVGSAPDSWGVWFADDPRQTPWERFLDEVAAAGYTRIELGPYGYLPTDPVPAEGRTGQARPDDDRRHHLRAPAPAGLVGLDLAGRRPGPPS